MERILPDKTKWEGVPYVGCAATVGVGSDSYPGTVVWVSEQTIDHEYSVYDKSTGKYEVVKVKLPKKIKVRGCHSRGVKGHNNAFTEDQRYVYYEDTEEDKEGAEYSYRKVRKNYVQVGTSSRSSAARAPSFGYRRFYRDPSF
jgi:hypothetical protein